MPQRPNDAKLRELILYISKKSEGDQTFGAVKLNKLLFYCDFRAYGYFGSSITGQEYQKLRQGPAPRRLLPAQQALIDNSDMEIVQTHYHDKVQNRAKALREADLSLFGSEEIALVDKVIAEFFDKNATQISEKSHTFVGWHLAEERETIPYEVALLGFRKPTDAEKSWGSELAGSAKGCLERDP